MDPPAGGRARPRPPRAPRARLIQPSDTARPPRYRPAPEAALLIDPPRHAHPDPRLVARVLTATPLRYTAGADVDADRPGHVRSASGLAVGGSDLWVVQDDARHVARIDPQGRVHAIPLPPGPDGRRLHHGPTKPMKADHEAAVWLDGALLLVGSGSTAARERLHLVHPDGSEREVDAAPLYAHLREVAAFSGSELNLEGAEIDGDHLVLAQRGNGAPAADRPPVDALGWLPLEGLRRALQGGPWPTLSRVQPWRFPDGLTLTDLCVDSGRRLATAAAEASPDTYQDGPVSAVALVDLDAGRTCPIVGLDPARHGKPEGLARVGPRTVAIVTDPDDPDRPAWLLHVVLEGPW